MSELGGGGFLEDLAVILIFSFNMMRASFNFTERKVPFLLCGAKFLLWDTKYRQ